MKFESIYRTHIKNYLEFKRNLGFKLRDAEYVYIQFDRLVLQRMEQSVGITKELSDAWCAKLPNESNGTRYDRIGKLSLFARYLCNIGYPSYIPEVPKFKSSFIPYIFTKEEIDSIIQASDRYCAERTKIDSYSLVMPTLLRLLYGTGLRIGEAIALLDKDVNIQDKQIIVRQSKNGTERIVPLSESVNAACQEYQTRRRKSIITKSDNILFFTRDNGSNCSSTSIYQMFRKILREAGISHRGKGLGPRLHDLRHTFACHSLAQMTRAGLDLYCAMPLLSTYLGHRTIESTEKYVRLTAEIYPELLNDIEGISSYVFPHLKTIAYETD